MLATSCGFAGSTLHDEFWELLPRACSMSASYVDESEGGRKSRRWASIRLGELTREEYCRSIRYALRNRMTCVVKVGGHTATGGEAQETEKKDRGNHYCFPMKV